MWRWKWKVNRCIKGGTYHHKWVSDHFFVQILVDAQVWYSLFYCPTKNWLAVTNFPFQPHYYTPPPIVVSCVLVALPFWFGPSFIFAWNVYHYGAVFKVHLLLVDCFTSWCSLEALLPPPSFIIYNLLIDFYYSCLYPFSCLPSPSSCWLFHSATLLENNCIICVSYAFSLSLMLSFYSNNTKYKCIICAKWKQYTKHINFFSRAACSIGYILFVVVVLVRFLLIVSFWYHLRPPLNTKFIIWYIFYCDSIIFTK